MLVLLDSKFSEGNDMMDAQLFRQFVFGSTAPLAGVVVTLAGLVALLIPVGAVVGIVSTTPAGIFGAIHNRKVGIGIDGVLAKVDVLASIATKDAVSIFELRGLNQKRLVTLLASAFNLIIAGAVFARVVFRQPFTKAIQGAKATFTVAILNYLRPALLTIDRFLNWIVVLAKVVFRIFHLASTRAILSRPTLAILKLFSAGGANAGSPDSLTTAFTRAVDFPVGIRTLVVPELFAAVGTNGGGPC